MAQYLLEADLQGNPEEAEQRKQIVSNQVAEWLRSKGHTGALNFALSDGRSAELEHTEQSTTAGEAETWSLLEEVEGGFLETKLRLGLRGAELCFWCTVSAAQGNNRLTPMDLDVFCPGVVRQILRAGRWTLGATPLSEQPLYARGGSGADDLVKALSDRNRSLPIVVVSMHLGLLVSPDLPSRLAKALTGLALVVVTDDEASWQLTNRVGKALSCYNGAVRLYWPGFTTEATPIRHPLWTTTRMLHRAASVEAAVKSICAEMRRLLNSVSTLALAEPSMLGEIRAALAKETAAAALKEMEDDSDYRSLADSYAEENGRLREDMAALTQQITQLRAQLYRWQTESIWADSDGDELHDDFVEPETLKDAVDRARVLFAGSVRFGASVNEGIAGLSPDAGPPEKVFTYLKALDGLAKARRLGPLGVGMLQWLKKEGNATGSSESDSIKNSPSEMKKRTWHDGVGHRPFELHLKPNDAAHPDKCVRIYFDWDETAEQVIVAWVGRHP